MAEAGLVDELEVEARRITELERRRRGKAEDHRFLRAGKVMVEARGDLLNTVALARPFLRGFKRHECETRGLSMAAIAVAAHSTIFPSSACFSSVRK